MINRRSLLYIIRILCIGRGVSSTCARFVLRRRRDHDRLACGSQSVVKNANVDLRPSIVVGEDDVGCESGR